MEIKPYGPMHTASHFSLATSNLSVGIHNIFFKVRDSNNVWSEEISRTITI